MIRIFSLFIVALLYGCATKSPQVNQLLKEPGSLPQKHVITDVPFTRQDEVLCAPSSLKMVLDYNGIHRSVDDLKQELLTPGDKGTYRTDLVTAARREGQLALELHGVSDLLKEVTLNHPVIVLQNVGLTSLPSWHYAVVTGFDLKKRLIYLHSGKKDYQKIPLRIFEETWSQSEYWGLVILDHTKLSETASEISHLQAAAGLENLGRLDEARTVYENILKRWPNSFLARVGLGNIFFTQKEYQRSLAELNAAVKLAPDSQIARHNRDIVQQKLAEVRRNKK